MNGFEKFDETKLPKKDFHILLRAYCVSYEDYEHLKKIWSESEINTMGDYHDFYLKTDVFLLTVVSEEFRNVCLK